MRPRPLLLTAAAVLAAVHVVGVLFARPLFRPAELLAALCLLVTAVRYDLLADRYPAAAGPGVPAPAGGQAGGDGPAGGEAGGDGPVGGGGRPAGGEVGGGGPAPADGRGGSAPVGGGAGGWGTSVAAAVLVAGAALTVPAAPGGEAGLQILSPEQYSELAWRVRLANLVPVVVALLFVLVLLAAQRHRAGTAAQRHWAGAAALGRRAATARVGGARRGPGRVILGTGVAAAVLIVGCLVLRAALIEFGTPRESLSSLAWSPTVWGLPAVVAVLLPLLLALAALVLAVVTAVRGRWRAAAGAVLLVAVGLIGLDSGIGAVPLPYTVYDYADPFSSDLIMPTAALPQPMQAVTAALRLAAAILIVSGRPGPGRSR